MKDWKKKSGCFSCNVRYGISNAKNLQLNKCTACFDLVTKRVISKVLSIQNNIIKAYVLFVVQQLESNKSCLNVMSVTVE